MTRIIAIKEGDDWNLRIRYAGRLVIKRDKISAALQCLDPIVLFVRHETKRRDSHTRHGFMQMRQRISANTLETAPRKPDSLDLARRLFHTPLHFARHLVVANIYKNMRIRSHVLRCYRIATTTPTID